MTKTSTGRKVTLGLFLLALTIVSACSAYKESDKPATPPKAENGCSKIADATLTAEVKAALSAKLRNKVAEAIKDDSKAGVVTLTGTVNFPGTKSYAGEVAKSVKCVQEVVNDIVVGPGPDTCPKGFRTCCCPETGCECIFGQCPICAAK